ncbi:HIT family protein [Natrinema caseinilyticum]|uniref:HIT family protein n=1 Tax=Natrinema caseinilyticum TaxID=2961570 RepID=UPI0020C3155A|nr:HIT domain-containing protein [Natrinema caseinilyticum]
MVDTCEFCRLIDGDRPAHVLFEDDRTIAFLDRRPAVTGHTLVVPRVHEAEILTIDEPTSTAVFETARTVASAIEETLEPDGFSMFHTSGPLVGTVEHAHVHIVLRFADDDVSLSRSRLDLDDATALTARLRAVL